MTSPGHRDFARAQRAEARVGMVIRGKYRLDSVLGIGGMAVVYSATHRNAKRFAVKVLHPELSLNTDVSTRFLREGYAANSVGHPGTVAVLDDDVAEDGSAFIVMELLLGSSVEAMRMERGGRLPIDTTVAIGTQMLDVLAAAHAKGIVHRDIKPANLFVTRDGVLKVLDFGIARVRDAAGAGGEGRTVDGLLLGTPAFMAPEQAIGAVDDVDLRSDLWGVGATLFTLLTGRFVHEADNQQHLLVAAATKRARPIASLMPEVPPDIGDVVDRGLAYDKANRWPSADEMGRALASAYRGASGGDIDVSAALRPPPLAPIAGSTTLTAPEDFVAPWSPGTVTAVSPPASLRSPTSPSTARPISTAAVPGPAAPRKRVMLAVLVGVAATLIAFFGVHELQSEHTGSDEHEHFQRGSGDDARVDAPAAETHSAADADVLHPATDSGFTDWGDPGGLHSAKDSGLADWRDAGVPNADEGERPRDAGHVQKFLPACNPPFYFEDGIRKFKRECMK